jgi:hypothetical protein
MSENSFSDSDDASVIVVYLLIAFYVIIRLTGRVRELEKSAKKSAKKRAKSDR